MGSALCSYSPSLSFPRCNELNTGTVSSLSDLTFEGGAYTVVLNPCTDNELIVITAGHIMKRYCLKSKKILDCPSTIKNGKVFACIAEEYIRQKSVNLDVESIRSRGSYHQLNVLNDHQIIFFGTLEYGAESQRLCHFYSIIDVSKWKFWHISFTSEDRLLPIDHLAVNGGLLIVENWMMYLKSSRICIWKIGKCMTFVRNESIQTYIYDEKGNAFLSSFGAIMDVSVPMRKSRMNNNNSNNNNNAKYILLFGNRRTRTDITSFIASFTLLIAAFDDNTLEITKACQSDVNQLFGFKLDVNKQFISFFEKCAISSFGHCLIDERYLVLIGGFWHVKDKNIKNSGRSVVVFDFRTRVWSLLDTLLPKPMFSDHGTTFIWKKEKPQKDRQLATMSLKMMEKACIHIICHDITCGHGASSLKLYLSRPLPWKSERLLWIGHLLSSKSDNYNSVCYLSIVPKDIIIYILLFCCNKVA